MQNITLQDLNDIFEKSKRSKMEASREKGKDGFADCIEDDTTRLSDVQKSTRIVREIVQGDGEKRTNDEKILE